MFRAEEDYMRMRFLLEDLLIDIGETEVSKSVEEEMRKSVSRTTAAVQDAIDNGRAELLGLRHILRASNK